MDDLCKLAESKRTQVAKNALIAIEELSKLLKKTLDPNVENFFDVCFRRALDTNEFISDQAWDSLMSVGANCNELKILKMIV